jgi:hypothetical protein
MKYQECDCAPVLSQGDIVGLISRSDLEEFVRRPDLSRAQKGIRVRALMRYPVPAIGPRDLILRAAWLMFESGLPGLPVVLGHRIEGLISWEKILSGFGATKVRRGSSAGRRGPIARMGGGSVFPGPESPVDQGPQESPRELGRREGVLKGCGTR